MFPMAHRLIPKVERSPAGSFEQRATSSLRNAFRRLAALSHDLRERPTFIAAAVLVLSDVVTVATLTAALHWAVNISATAARTGRPPAVPDEKLSLPWFAIVAGLSIVSFCGRRRHYTQRPAALQEAKDIFFITFWCFTSLLTLWGVAASPILDSQALILMALCPLALCGSRDCTKQMLLAIGLWQIPVVLVGEEPGVQQASAILEQGAKAGYRVVNVISPHAGGDAPSGGVPASWSYALARCDARQVVVVSGMSLGTEQVVLTSLLRHRIPFALFSHAEIPSMLAGGQTISLGQGAGLLFYSRARPFSRATKTAIDLTIAAVILIAILPVLLCIALLVRLDGGPALFAHERVGAQGRRFKCLKFRSMAMNADVLLRDLIASDPAAAVEWAETRKLTHDPRVTKVGRILRKTSLDELPQLINVLRLEMSLVGPRPIVEQEVSRYAEDIAYYYEARPGITGLWQVSGRSNTSYERRVHLDCWYAKNWTLWDDLVILAWTVPAVLGRKGAR